MLPLHHRCSHSSLFKRSIMNRLNIARVIVNNFRVASLPHVSDKAALTSVKIFSEIQPRHQSSTAHQINLSAQSNSIKKACWFCEASRNEATKVESSLTDVQWIDTNREKLSQLLSPQSSWQLRRAADDVMRSVAGRSEVLSLTQLMLLIQRTWDMFPRTAPLSNLELLDLARHMLQKFDPQGTGGVARSSFPQLFRYCLSHIRDCYYPPKIRFFKEYVTHKRDGDIMKVYDRMEFIGKGKFGASYVVRDRHSGWYRVCKWINKPSVMIENELHSLQALDHPSIVKLIEVYETVSHVALVYEYLGKDVQTLLELLQESSSNGSMFGEERAKTIFRQLATGVAHCHANYVTHKDLKPENILVLPKNGTRGDLRVKIIDFGLSEIFGAGERLTTTAGSPYYMAPEVYGESFNYKCDAWSLGVIMYVMLTGHLPFSAKTPEAYAHLVKNCDISFPHELFKGASPASIDLLNKCLQRDPRSRPSAMEILTHRWLQDDRRHWMFENSVIPQPRAPVESRLLPSPQTQIPNVDHETLRRLRDSFMVFSQKSSLKRALLNAFTYNVNVFQIPSMSLAIRIFEALDKDHDGALSEKEITEGLEAMRVPTAQVPRIIDAMDVDNSGVISFTQFITPILVASQEDIKDYATAVFRQIDSNADGLVSANEIRHMLLSSGAKATSSVAKFAELIKTIVDELSVTEDKGVNYEQFYKFLFES
eukprot:Selendium_serpulae@DN5367_c0_g1_i2.p1